MQNLCLKSPSLDKIKGKIKILSTHIIFYKKIVY